MEGSSYCIHYTQTINILSKISINLYTSLSVTCQCIYVTQTVARNNARLKVHTQLTDKDIVMTTDLKITTIP